MITTILQNKTIRKTGQTLLFYLVAFGLINYLAYLYPSGPCNPGLGIMLIFLLPVFSLFLCIYNAVKVGNDKTNKPSAIIHLIVVIAFALLLFTLKFIV